MQSRTKKLKVWFGGFPGNAKTMDLCVEKEIGESGTMYYMVYVHTSSEKPICKRFVCLCRVDEKESIEGDLGVRFPKWF